MASKSDINKAVQNRIKKAGNRPVPKNPTKDRNGYSKSK